MGKLYRKLLHSVLLGFRCISSIHRTMCVCRELKRAHTDSVDTVTLDHTQYRYPLQPFGLSLEIHSPHEYLGPVKKCHCITVHTRTQRSRLCHQAGRALLPTLEGLVGVLCRHVLALGQPAVLRKKDTLHE
jgi:hypothetical protein